MKERPDWTENLLSMRGCACALVGEWQMAYDDTRVLCLKMNNLEPDSWLLLGLSGRNLHDPNYPVYLRKGVFLSSPAIEQEYQKGLEALNMGDFEEARIQFQKCEEMTANLKIMSKGIFHWDLCFFDYRLGRWDDLHQDIQVLGGCEFMNPEMISMLFPRISTHMEELEDWVGLLGELIEKDPLPLYYAWRARILAMRYEFFDISYSECREKILHDLELALKPDLQDPEILTVSAGTYFLLDDLSACLDCCSRLEKIKFKNQTWCFWKAMVLLRQGQPAAAVEPLKTYIRYCETCPTESFFNVSMGKAMLAICHARQNQFEKAEQILAELHSCFPEKKRRMLEMLLFRAQKKDFPQETEQFLGNMNSQQEKGKLFYSDFLFIFLCAEHQYAARNTRIATYLIELKKFSQKKIFYYPPAMNVLSEKAIRYILRLDETPPNPSESVIFLETNGNEWLVLQDLLLR